MNATSLYFTARYAVQFVIVPLVGLTLGVLQIMGHFQ